jgi:hypothetical protein
MLGGIMGMMGGHDGSIPLGASISHWEPLHSTGVSVKEFSIENFPNNSSGGDDDGWCMAIEVDVPRPMEGMFSDFFLI